MLQATSQAHRGTSGSNKGGNKKEKEKDKVFMGEVLLRFRHTMSTAKDGADNKKDREEKEVTQVCGLLKFMFDGVNHNSVPTKINMFAFCLFLFVGDTRSAYNVRNYLKLLHYYHVVYCFVEYCMYLVFCMHLVDLKGIPLLF